MNLNLIEEDCPGKVSGEFADSHSARLAKDALVSEAALDPDHVKIIKPDDAALSRKLEPESHGIALTLVKTHVVLGLAGLLCGLVVSFLLVRFGPALAASSPFLTTIGITTIATFAGLILAGLISLRPDHDPLIIKAKESQRAGHWTVVAHTADSRESVRAQEVLKHRGALACSHTL